MKFYVANCSKSNCVLNYRLPEVKNPLTQPVDSGHQIMLAKPDLNLIQIENFIDQMRAYGLYLAEEISNGINKNELIYWLGSIDKPMKVDTIQRAFAHNDEALRQQGVAFRKAASIAAHKRIDEYSPHAAGTMEITIQEESEKNSGPTGEPLTAEGYRIDRGA